MKTLLYVTHDGYMYDVKYVLITIHYGWQAVLSTYYTTLQSDLIWDITSNLIYSSLYIQLFDVYCNIIQQGIISYIEYVYNAKCK